MNSDQKGVQGSPLAGFGVSPNHHYLNGFDISIVDCVVIGAALGSGFGLTEDILSFGYMANGAQFSVPDIATIFTSWLPTGETSGINLHLVWSALVGLSVGLFLRGRSYWKWMALLPFLVAGLGHAANNAVAANPAETVASGISLPDFLDPSGQVFAFYPLVALGVAIWLDRLIITRALANESALHFSAERQRPFGLISFVLTHTSKPWSLVKLWLFVLQRRGFALNKAIMPEDSSLLLERSQLASMCASLEHNQPISPPVFLARLTRPTGQPVGGVARPRPRLTLQVIFLSLLALPPLLYFVVGDFPATAGLQDVFAQPIVFPALIVLLVAGMIWQGGMLIRHISRLPQVLEHASPWAIPMNAFGLLTTLGAIGFGAIGVIISLTGHDPLQPIIPDLHLLERLASSSLLTLLVLSQLALLLPPLFTLLRKLVQPDMMPVPSVGPSPRPSPQPAIRPQSGFTGRVIPADNLPLSGLHDASTVAQNQPPSTPDTFKPDLGKAFKDMYSDTAKTLRNDFNKAVDFFTSFPGWVANKFISIRYPTIGGTIGAIQTGVSLYQYADFSPKVNDKVLKALSDALTNPYSESHPLLLQLDGASLQTSFDPKSKKITLNLYKADGTLKTINELSKEEKDAIITNMAAWDLASFNKYLAGKTIEGGIVGGTGVY